MFSKTRKDLGENKEVICMPKDKKKKKVPALVVAWRKMMMELATCYEDVKQTSAGNQNARIRLRKKMQESKNKADEVRKLAQEYAK